MKSTSFCLNFGTITLLPKEKEVKRIQQYRPICMLNVSFKIFTKVLANKLTSVACSLLNLLNPLSCLEDIFWKEW
jgi:hypothetical protein